MALRKRNQTSTGIADVKAALKPGARLLGLDVGAKTIGLALSDATLTVASPYAILLRRRLAEDVAELGRIIAKEGVGGLIIGLPLNMDGSEGPRCQSVRQFRRNLASHISLPMAFWDERLSTRAVSRALIVEADVSRKRRAELTDKLAAAYILQGALDALKARV
jgi:putative Holliday junction resolvase